MVQYLLTSRKCSCESLCRTGAPQMTRIQTLACSACLIFVEVAAAAADTTTDAPKSLRMRARPSEATYSSPMPGGKRVAQPTPDEPPGSGPTPATDPTGPGP